MSSSKEKKPGYRVYAFAAAAVFVFLLLTGARLPFYEAIKLVDANDVHSYLRISAAAPDFPGEPVAFHFAQRFIPHYCVGIFSRFTGLGLERTYHAFNFTLIAAMLLLFSRLAAGKARPAGIALLAFALAALSPYAFRLNFLVPVMLADMVFTVGLAVSLYGLQEKKVPAVILGALFAASGKQMALLVLPGLALYSYTVFAERFGRARSAAFAASLAAAVFLFNGLLARWSYSFAAENIIGGGVIFGLFPWLGSDLFSVPLLAEHVLRTFLPALPFIALACAGLRNGGLKAAFTAENAALLLIILGPMAYAFLPGPVLQMHNQSRYTGSVVLPMALLALNVLPAGGYRLAGKDLLLLAPLLAVYSYHHRYCWLQSAPGVFLGVHLFSLAGLFLWLRLRLPGSGTASAGGEQLPD